MIPALGYKPVELLAKRGPTFRNEVEAPLQVMELGQRNGSRLFDPFLPWKIRWDGLLSVDLDPVEFTGASARDAKLELTTNAHEASEPSRLNYGRDFSDRPRPLIPAQRAPLEKVLGSVSGRANIARSSHLHPTLVNQIHPLVLIVFTSGKQSLVTAATPPAGSPAA